MWANHKVSKPRGHQETFETWSLCDFVVTKAHSISHLKLQPPSAAAFCEKPGGEDGAGEGLVFAKNKLISGNSRDSSSLRSSE